MRDHLEDVSEARPETAERPPRRLVRRARNLPGDAVLTVAAVALAAGAAAWAWRDLSTRLGALEDALAIRPPLAVADYGAISSALAAGVAPATIQPAFADVKAEAARLAEAGWLVVNRAAVETPPAALTFGPGPDAARRLAAAVAAAAELRAAPVAPVAGLSPAPGAPPSGMTDAEAAALLRGLVETPR